MVDRKHKRFLFTTIVLLSGLSCLVQAEMRFEHVINIGSAGQNEGQFEYVEDFAFNKKGQLLATDAAHAYVQVFDKTTGVYVTRFGGKGDDDQHLDKPEGIAVDPAGNIFIADYNTGFVKKYDSSYQWLKTFSEYGTALGQNIKSEFSSVYNGKFYMPEVGSNRVNVFDLEGKFLFSFGSQGTEPGKLNNPEAAKPSSTGFIYVSDLKNDRIQVFQNDGQFVKTWGKSGNGPGEFKAPAGLSLDKNDNVYVTEIGNDRIQVFDKDGKFLTTWGHRGNGNGEFANLHGIIVDSVTGWVYVADTGNHRIQVFRPVEQ